MSRTETASPERRRGLLTAACLVVAGLAVEVVSLAWTHPTAFVLFLGAGGLLVAAGVLRYFFAIVPRTGAGE